MSQPDYSELLENLFRLRYGDIVTCPKCNGQSSFYRVSGRPSYSCEWCGRHLSPQSGTIFQKTATPLETWKQVYDRFKEGASLKQIERETKLTYKTVWRISHLTRTLKPTDIEYKLLN